VDEDRFGGVLPRGLEQVERAYRVHVEVDQGDISRFVMGGLGGAVYYKVVVSLREEDVYSLAVAYVEVVVAEAAGYALEALKVPGGIARRTKEVPTHIVVNAVHVVPLAVKVLDCCGADQAAASRNQYSHLLEIMKDKGKRINEFF